MNWFGRKARKDLVCVPDVQYPFLLSNCMALVITGGNCTRLRNHRQQPFRAFQITHNAFRFDEGGRILTLRFSVKRKRECPTTGSLNAGHHSRSQLHNDFAIPVQFCSDCAQRSLCTRPTTSPCRNIYPTALFGSLAMQ